FSSRRRHTRSKRDWSSDVCSSDLLYDVAGAFWVVVEFVDDFQNFVLGRGFWQFAVQRSDADFFHITDFGTDIRLRSWISSNQHGAKTGSHTPFFELRDPFCEVFFYMCRSSAAVKF